METFSNVEQFLRLKFDNKQNQLISTRAGHEMKEREREREQTSGQC